MAYNGCLSVQRAITGASEFIAIGASPGDAWGSILHANASIFMTPAQAVWLRDALNDLLTQEDAEAAAKAREDV